MWKKKCRFVCLFCLILYVPVNSFFSHVRMCLSGFNQYWAEVNCADPGEMQHYAAFHLGLHGLSNYCLGVSNILRV